MLDRIQEIDTGAIEELTRIRRDQEVLEDRLRLMAERREGVSEVVFERVRGDYRTRLDALDQEARPLKERARREYGKLAVLRGELQQSRDDATLEKEEVDFRNGLGEFPDGEYERRAADCAERVSGCEAELAEVETLRERFLASCRSAEELEGAEPPPAEEAMPAGDDADAALVVSGDELPRLAVEDPFAPPPAGAALDATNAVTPLLGDQESAADMVPPALAYDYNAFDSGNTSRLEPDVAREEDARSLDGLSDAADLDMSGTRARDDWHERPTGSFAVPPLPPGAHLEADSPDDELSGATRILTRPRLVELENGASGREHPLALGRTSIGRASDNLVHLLDEAVSRHHAEVVPGPQGYLLRDLSSENGIFVNGERAPEHVLRDGDVIQIGARTLVFHGA